MIEINERKKQERTSSIGAKIVSFVTEEFKEKTLRRICPISNTNLVRFPEKVMSHYIQYKLLPCIEQLTVYRQNYRQNYRQTELIVE